MTTTTAPADDEFLERDFTELIRLAKQGDPDALRELHARYEHLVLAVVHKRLAPPLRRRFDTVDIVQSVFEDVLRDLADFEDRGEEAFKHWLCMKAENKIRDAWRRQLNPGGGQREAGLVTADGEGVAAHGPGPATNAEAGDDHAHLRRVLASLPAAQQEILKLHDQDGLTYAQIAERLGGASQDAVRMRHARALEALRKAWGQQ